MSTFVSLGFMLYLKLPQSCLFSALTEPSIDYGFHRLGKLVPRHPGDPEKLPKEIVLKRAADLAEALYSMPRNNQLALTAAGSPRSPSAISASAQQAAAMHAGFNSYSGQLAVSVQENAVANGQWAEGNFSQFMSRVGGNHNFVKKLSLSHTGHVHCQPSETAFI